MRHLLSVTDLDAAPATALLDTADRLKQALLGREVRKLPTLRGRTVVTMFYENSTRTRVSFEVAGKWMSADTINVSASGSSVGKGESLRDTAATLAAIGADCIVVRHPASGAAHRMAHWAERDAAAGAVGPTGPGSATSVVNAGDGTHEHPTQALLDAATLRDRLGGVAGRRIGIVGDVLHSRVARSNVFLLATLGAEVVLVAPPDAAAGRGRGVAVPGRRRPGGRAARPGRGDDAAGAGRADARRVLPLVAGVRGALRAVRTPCRRCCPSTPWCCTRGRWCAAWRSRRRWRTRRRAAVLAQVQNGVHVRMAVLYHLLAGAAA